MKLEVRDVTRNEDKIERSLAADLVGDADVTALRVLDLRHLHANSLRRARRLRNVVRKVRGPRLEPGRACHSSVPPIGVIRALIDGLTPSSRQSRGVARSAGNTPRCFEAATVCRYRVPVKRALN